MYLQFHIFRLASKTFPVSSNYYRGCIYQHTLHWYMFQTYICQNFGAENFNLLLPINLNSLWDRRWQKDMSLLLGWYRNKVQYASVSLIKVSSALFSQDPPSGAMHPQVSLLHTTVRRERGETCGFPTQNRGEWLWKSSGEGQDSPLLFSPGDSFQERVQLESVDLEIDSLKGIHASVAPAKPVYFQVYMDPCLKTAALNPNKINNHFFNQLKIEIDLLAKY